MNDKIKKRFNKKYTIRDNGCWEWTNGAPGSYQNFRVGSKVMGAHRASYTIFHGEIPDGMMVCHTCDNPRCVNPEHLFLGASKDNTQDMMKKERDGFSVSKITGRRHDPATLKSFRLYPDDIEAIRAYANATKVSQSQAVRDLIQCGILYYAMYVLDEESQG